MAQLGDQLTSPEVGWKRYDDTDGSFSKKGTGWNNFSYSGAYGGSSWRTSGVGSAVEFDFISDKMRLISPKGSDHATDIKVMLDGVEVAHLNNRYSGQPSLLQRIVYQVEGLTNERHKIRFENVSGGYLYIDAVDINENGRLLHPDEVLDPKDLNIGKRIRANYFASAGKVGALRGLGKENMPYLGTTPTSTPNGDFLLIAVDKNHLGGWKLIADRVVQNMISWDTLNSEGVPYGTVSPIKFMENNFASARGNNVTDSVVFPNQLVIDLMDGRSEFSIYSDIQLTSASGGTLFYSTLSGGNAWKIAISLNTERVELCLRRYSGDALVVYNMPFTTSLKVGKRYSFAVTVNSDVNKAMFYLNGVLFGETTIFNDTGVFSGGVGDYGPRMFEYTSGTSRYISDMIADNLSFWTKVLTQSDIVNLIDRKPKINDVGLLAYYAFDEGMGTVGKELTGKYNAVMKATSWDVPLNNLYIDSKTELDKLKNVNYLVRLMTGGIASTDKGNEWDKYIVSSDLGGSIVAGDNLVWNWSGVYTGTSTTQNGNSANRIARGSTALSTTSPIGTNSSTANATFRPLLEINISETVTPDPDPDPDPPIDDVSNQIYEIESGLLFIDNFNELNSRWIVSPPSSYSISDREGFLRLKHNENNDVLMLVDKPNFDIAIQAFVEYSPIVVGDEGGLLVYRSSTQKVEFLENKDDVNSLTQREWLAESEGDVWNFFTKKADGFEFVENGVLDAVKLGLTLKKGNGTDFANLDVDRVIVTRGRKLTLKNLEQSIRVVLKDINETIVSDNTVQEGMTGLEIVLPSLEFEGTLEIYSIDGQLFASKNAVFYGGDVYSLGTLIQIMWGENELETTESTNIGNMVGGVREIKLDIHNPSGIVINNLKVAITQYMDKFGYTWADIAEDINGSPSNYVDELIFPTMNPLETKSIWLKVTKGHDYMGLENLKFNIHIEHD